MKTLGILLFTLALSSLLPVQSNATVYHSDGSAANVQNIHNTQATDGDTITIPLGAFNWSTPVSISKAIKLQGQGSGRIVGNTKSQVTIGTGSKTFATTRVIPGIVAGQTLRVAKMPPGPARNAYMEGTVTSYSGTTLVMNITSTGGGGAYKFWWIATNPATQIVNNAGSAAINIHQPNSAAVEIAGIKVVNPALHVSANTYAGPRTLVHDCWFQSATGGDNVETETNRLLIWNCSFDDTFSQASLGVHSKQDTDTSRPSWSNNSTMGTEDINGATNLYIEDCDFHAYLNAGDFDDNSRVVFRHNTLDNSGMGSHGADTSPYGLRHIEMYNNELIFDDFGDCDGSVTLNVNWFFWMRGGTAVITDNILPAISSCAWGQKGNVLFSVLNTRRNSGPYCCWTNYPAPHQIGQGYGNGAAFHQYISQCGSYSGDDYSYYIYAEPVYIWNNSGTGGNRTGLNEEDQDACGNNQHLSDWVQAGRDYVVGPKPGYQKFTYPHPLRGVSAVEDMGRAVIADFNNDSNPDYVLQRNGAPATAIWYLDNNTLLDGDLGPAPPIAWHVAGAADFNGDGHPDYVLAHPGRYTAIWYMSGPALTGGAFGPTIAAGWEVVGVADFNGDGHPDYVLYRSISRQTAIWYLNNNVLANGEFAPTITSGWKLVGVADFDHDGHTDYALFRPTTGQTGIWYLSGTTFVGSAYGPTLPSGWGLVGTADFDGDGNSDFLLYNPTSHETAIWYLDNNVLVNSAFGPTIPATWGWPVP